MEMLTFHTARGRLRDALDLLDACQGIATSDGTPPDVMPAPIDRPLSDYLVGLVEGQEDLPPVIEALPKDWTVRQVIARAADEARHGAQEALDEIAHADGWPRF